jgi:hypothetical protein
MKEGTELANVKRNPPSEKKAGPPPAPQPSGNDTVTIPRTLAFRLLGSMEELAECQHLEDRSAEQIARDGDMPTCYHQLRVALLPSPPKNDLIDIERD